jgi:hypothetical protein
VIEDARASIPNMESKYDDDSMTTYQVCEMDSKTEHLSSAPQRRGLGLDLSRAQPSQLDAKEEELECDRNPQEAEILVS